MKNKEKIKGLLKMIYGEELVNPVPAEILEARVNRFTTVCNLSVYVLREVQGMTYKEINGVYDENKSGAMRDRFLQAAKVIKYKKSYLLNNDPITVNSNIEVLALKPADEMKLGSETSIQKVLEMIKDYESGLLALSYYQKRAIRSAKRLLIEEGFLED